MDLEEKNGGGEKLKCNLKQSTDSWPFLRLQDRQNQRWDAVTGISLFVCVRSGSYQ